MLNNLLAILLFALAMFATTQGIQFLTGAKSAIHQILSAITFLIAAVLLSGGCVVLTNRKQDNA